MEQKIQKYLKKNNKIAVNGKDYFLQDDGNGVYIKSWNVQGLEKPTIDQLSSLELDVIKDIKIQQIYFARINFQYTNLTIDGQIYKATESAKNKFWALVNGTNITNYPLDWRLADNITWVQLTKDQANALYIAMEQQEKSAYQQESVLLAQINNATTLDEINAININFE